MVHRWHYRKIKGAQPLYARLVEQVYNSSPLLKAMLAK